MENNKTQPYHILARFYNALSDDRDWDSWTNYVTDTLRAYAGKGNLNILDAACGTGRIAVSLQKRGFQVLGVDISPGMLAQADAYSRSEGVPVQFICQDLIDLDLQAEFDAALCLCDSLNYLTDIEDLTLAVEKIAVHLKKGGLFLFDVNTKEKLANIYGNHVFADHHEGFSYIWMNEYDGQNAMVTMYLTFFVETDNGNYQRFDEIHMEKAYGEKEIQLVLAKAGLKLVACGNDLGELPEPLEQRAYYLAKKI